MPVDADNFVSGIRVHTGNIISSLMNRDTSLKFITGRNRKAVPSEIVVEGGVLNRGGDSHAMPLELPFPLAPFHDCFNNIKVGIFLDHSSFRLWIAWLIPDLQQFTR